MSRAPARPASLTRRPFLGATAVAAGLLTKEQLRSSAWQRLLRGVYLDARLPADHRQRALGAALLLPPGAAIAGRSAAHLYGTTLAEPGDPVEISTPTPFGPVAGLLVRQRHHAPDELRGYHGTPVTTPLATAYELARSLPLEEAVVWLDALGRVRGLRPEQLRAHAARHRGRPRWYAATRAIGLCDFRAESPPESRVRLWLTLAGLPPAVSQHRVFSDGEFVARVDLAWPALKLALEYDGRWHADPGQLTRDRRRVRALNALGWYVYPVTSGDLSAPSHRVDQLRRLLRERGGSGRMADSTDGANS